MAKYNYCYDHYYRRIRRITVGGARRRNNIIIGRFKNHSNRGLILNKKGTFF